MCTVHCYHGWGPGGRERDGTCYPAPDFRAEWHTLQACAVKFFASVAASATRASGTELSQVLRIFPPTNTDLWAQKILASSTNEEAAPVRVRHWISLMFHTHGLATAHERTAPTLGRAAAKEGAGQDLPEPLGPAASQTLDPRAGNPNAAIQS